MAESSEDIRKNFERLQKLSDQLGKNFSEFNLRPIAEDAAKVRELLAAWQRELNDIETSAESIAASFREVVNSISTQNVGLQTANKSFRSIANLADEIADHQLKRNKLSKDELTSIEDKLNKEYKILERNISNLRIAKSELDQAKRRGVLTDKQESQLRRINNALAESEVLIAKQEGPFKDLLVNINLVNADIDRFNKKLGFTGHAAQGIVSAFEGLGLKGLSKTIGLDDALVKMKEMAQFQADRQKAEEELYNLNEKGLSASQIRAGFGGKELKEKQLLLDKLNEEAKVIGANAGKLSVIGAGLKSMGQSFAKNITDPAFLITEMVQALISSDEATGRLAKDFNLTYNDALATRQELSQMAALSGDVAVNTKGLQESMVAVGKSLGSNAMLNEKDLVTFTKLREQAGYTNEELIGIQKLSLVNGKTLEDNTEEILGGAKAYASRRGLVINEKDVLKEISKASASVKLSLGGSADELARSVVQAKAFGLTLEQADKMAESLLNFESSIENELSAELLTGKDLNLENARRLALNNDIAGAAEEVAKQVGTSADFANMNRIQQEAIAKAAGLTRDELAQSLMDKEALSKISAKEGESAQQAFNRLVKEVGLEEAKKQLGDEQLATQFSQQNIQERFANATEKLKELFVSMAEPILQIVSPLVNLVTAVLPVINLLLQPILFVFQSISDAIRSFTDLLHGETKSGLGFILQIVQSIAVAWGGYVALQQLSNKLGIVKYMQELKFGGILKKQFWTTLATGIGNLWSGIVKMLGPYGIPVAIAATAGLVGAATALFSKGNDILSPGDGSSGYGKRTLFGPEGAISLNNKDTVIAGTDLFQKGNDVAMAPAGAMSVSNLTAPKREVTRDPNSGVISAIRDLMQVTGKVNEVSTLKIQ
jgi:hypothetical protein